MQSEKRMTSSTPSRRAADLMQRSFAALAAKDVDRLAGFWNERTTDVIIPLQLEMVGEAPLRAFFEELFAAVPDLQFEVETVHAVDEHTAIGQWRMIGTFSGGRFQGIEPTGRRIELRGIDVMSFEGNLLRHNDVYYDGLSFARQIGLLPSAHSLPDRGMAAAFNTLSRAKRFARQRLNG